MKKTRGFPNRGERYGTKYENGVAYLLSYTVSVEKLWTQNTRIIHDVWRLLILSNEGKNEWLWFFLKRNDLYENFEKRGGSREKGGGRNKIHAPCACGLLYILQAKISCFVNAGSLSAMFNLKTSSKRQLIFLSFFTWIMVVLNNKYVDMFNL